MKLLIEIKCDNAAFEDEGIATECARILQLVTRKLCDGQLEAMGLHDVNGNHVGYAKFED